MAKEYTNLFNSNALKFTQIGIFGLKIYHLATLIQRPIDTKLQTLLLLLPHTAIVVTINILLDYHTVGQIVEAVFFFFSDP
jgi:hypothetical protein